MRNYFTFGTIDSRDYGVYISGNGRIRIPTREYEFAAIPGRLGDVAISKQRIENEEVSYPAYIAPVNGACGNYANYQEAFFALRNALLSAKGYQTLTDSYDSTHYREGVFVGGISADSLTNLSGGSFELVFNCSPKRFVTLPNLQVAAGTTSNFTSAQFPSDKMNCEPIIRAFMAAPNSSFSIGTSGNVTTVTYTAPTANTFFVDCKRKDCYFLNGESANGFVQLSNYIFPAFGPFFGNAGLCSATSNGPALTISPGAFLL